MKQQRKQNSITQIAYKEQRQKNFIGVQNHTVKI